MADDALALHLGADHESGNVGEIEDGNAKGIAEPDEARRLVGAVDEEHGALVLGLAGDDADRPPFDAGEGGDDFGSEELLDLEERAGVDQLGDEQLHVEELVLVGGDDLLDALAGSGGGDRLGQGQFAGETLGEECEISLGGLDGFRLGLDEHVAAARDGAVHARAAQVLERDLLADDHLGHARRAQVHGGVALDHHHDVAEGGDVRAAGRARPEEQADLRHQARHLALHVEDAARAAAAGEHLDLIGDARPGAVDQVEHRTAHLLRLLLDADDLLHRAPAPGAGLDGGVVGHHRHQPAGDLAQAGDHAVGGQLRVEPVRERAVLDEAALVEEKADALAGEELAGLGILLVVLGRPALLDARQLRLQLLVEGHWARF